MNGTTRLPSTEHLDHLDHILLDSDSEREDHDESEHASENEQEEVIAARPQPETRPTDRCDTNPKRTKRRKPGTRRGGRGARYDSADDQHTARWRGGRARYEEEEEHGTMRGRIRTSIWMKRTTVRGEG